MSNPTVKMQRRMADEKTTAAYTGRASRTLQMDRVRGTGFPYYKIRGSIRYDLNEIDTYIATCARGPRRELAAAAGVTAA